MQNRRGFVKAGMGLVSGAMLLLMPGIRMLETALAGVKRILLGPDTDIQTLKNRHPGRLDTSQLPVTPIDTFQTMGETEIETQLNDWNLQISGNVDHPLTLTYQDLMTLPSIERDVLLICPGFFAQNGRWKGLDMAKLLARVHPGEKASRIIFRGSPDSYKSGESFSLDQVKTNQVFLAYQVNGHPLSVKHGFPLRVVAEDVYGGNWLKYVHSLEIQ